MWANPPEVEFLGTISKCRKRNRISSLLVYVLHKTRKKAFSRRGRAKTGKEMYKKRDAPADLLFCSLNIPFFFFTFLSPSASVDLKVLSVGRYATTLKHGCVAD